MKNRIASVRSIAAIAAAVLTILLSGKAEAHPQLRGTWTCGPGINNSGSFAASDTVVIQAGQEIAPGVWRGQFTNFRNGLSGGGTYTLRMSNQHEGVCTFGSETAQVHLGYGRMVFGSAVYNRDW
jgi:hypothetical protein